MRGVLKQFRHIFLISLLLMVYIYGCNNFSSKTASDDHIRKAAFFDDSETDFYAPSPRDISIADLITLETEFTKTINKQQVVVGVHNIMGDCYGGSGTGFFLSKNIIATANHVVTPAEGLGIRYNKNWEETEKIGQTYIADIAFLYYKNHEQIKLPLFVSPKKTFQALRGKKQVPIEQLLVGMRCMARATPFIIIGKLQIWQPKDHLIAFAIRNDVRGCSGAPVFTFKGEIIGIFQSTIGTMGFARSIDDVQSAFNSIQKAVK